jgi:hypothetical protein
MNQWIAKVCFVTMLATACASAQDVEKLVEVKHVQPNGALRNLFDVLGVRMSDPVAGYIALKGPKDSVAAAEEALHHMDVEKPTQDVEITGWLVIESAHESDPVPEELAPVARQLRAVFGYSNLRLLTSFALRTKSGGSGTAGGIVGPGFYNFSTSRVDVSGEVAGAHKLHLMAVHFDCSKSNLMTDVDLTEGQKVVIGKTSMSYGSAPAPLILVLSARVVSE